MTVEAALNVPAIRLGNLVLWPGECQGFAADRRLDLTRREFQVLHALASHPGHVLSKELIHELAWGPPLPGPRDRSVHVYVRKVRVKLERAAPHCRYIHTHFGLGYRFEPEQVSP